MGQPDMEDFAPAPFPDDVPTIGLEKISLNKLLNNDEFESRNMFEICASTGFFYLNMMDHPKGRELWEDACHACRVGRQVLPNHSIEEKQTYKTRDRFGIFDKGYFCGYAAKDGRPRYSESFNVRSEVNETISCRVDADALVQIPQTEMFSSEPTSLDLPPWLAEHRETFRAALKSGNMIANNVLSVLERELQLPPRSFTSLHRLTDDSSDFLRVLRYPGFLQGKSIDKLGFPPHRDAISVAILFTWLGGLQIPKVEARNLAPTAVAEGDWLWVKPLTGHAIVNLDDAMEIFTNKVLKSGLHRVVKAPGGQAPYDKYSVLLGTRPNNQALMKAFESPVIPEYPPEQAKAEVLTSEQWGTAKINGLQDLTSNQGRGVIKTQ